MDIATLIGFISGIIFMLISMLLGVDFDVGKLIKSFVDPTSVMITFGGCIAGTLIANPLSTIITAMKAVKFTISPPKADVVAAIKEIVRLAVLARRESLLALEEEANKMDDPFLKKGLTLIVDATEESIIREVLETEISYIESRHGDVRGVWDFVASAGPAWGMIGTLIGLVLMLNEMNDPSTLGPKMAVAIITTFYGSILANFIAAPIANKLKTYSGDEILLKEVQLVGLLSLQAGENPRIIEERLKAYVSASMGATITENGAGE